MIELPAQAPVVTGKGNSVLVAEAFARARKLAPRPPRSHREENPRCRCARCAFIIGEVCRELHALKWSYDRIGKAVGRTHQAVNLHCSPAYRARKREWSRKWRAAHPYIPVQRRTKDQQTWDNLGASNDAR